MGQAPETQSNTRAQTEKSLPEKAEETIRLFKTELDGQRLNIALQVYSKKLDAAAGIENACASSNLDTKKSCQENLEVFFREQGDKADSRQRILFELTNKFQEKATLAFEALKAEYSKPSGGERKAIELLSKNLTEIIDVYYSYDKINLGRQSELLDMTPENRSKALAEISKLPPRPLPESAKPAVK